MIRVNIFKRLTAAKKICSLSLWYLTTCEVTDHIRICGATIAMNRNRIVCWRDLCVNQVSLTVPKEQYSLRTARFQKKKKNLFFLSHDAQESAQC